MQRGCKSSPHLAPYALSPVKSSKPQRWTQEALDNAIQCANSEKEKAIINPSTVDKVGHWTQDTLDAEIQRLAEKRDAEKIEAGTGGNHGQAWTQSDLDNAIQRLGQKSSGNNGIVIAMTDLKKVEMDTPRSRARVGHRTAPLIVRELPQEPAAAQRQGNAISSPSKSLRLASTAIVPSTNLEKAMSSSVSPPTGKQLTQVVLDDALQRLVEERIQDYNRNSQSKGVVNSTGPPTQQTAALSPCSTLVPKSKVRFAVSPRGDVQQIGTALQDNARKDQNLIGTSPTSMRLAAKDMGSPPKLPVPNFDKRPESPWATSSSCYGAHSSVAGSSSSGDAPRNRVRDAHFRTLALVHSHH